jgi:hypothetical protein
VADDQRRLAHGLPGVDEGRRARHPPWLAGFALSPRFDRELSAIIARTSPGCVITDESAFSKVVDHLGQAQAEARPVKHELSVFVTVSYL